MKAAEKKHSDPDDTQHYVPNYSVVAGINADFYNMSNGAPSGALVMEGVEYHAPAMPTSLPFSRMERPSSAAVRNGMHTRARSRRLLAAPSGLSATGKSL